MITIIKTEGNKVYGHCLSTDTKPKNVGNGSELIEIDNSKLYIFDEENKEWDPFEPQV